MPLTIKIARPKNMQALFSKTKLDAKKHGISWAGDTRHGYCKGFGFEGTYVVDKNYITICVLKKPPFVSKARIEKAVKKYLSVR